MVIDAQQALSSFLEELVRTQRFEQERLPIERSMLCRELILLIALHTLKDRPLIVKALFHSVEYSELGARKHLRRLLKDGWCVLVPAKDDSRKRYVVAAEKMLELFRNYYASVEIAYKLKSENSQTI